MLTHRLQTVYGLRFIYSLARKKLITKIVIKNLREQIIVTVIEMSIVRYVRRSEVKNDSLSTYFIINCNVRIGRSMFHAKTTIVLQRFDYL